MQKKCEERLYCRYFKRGLDFIFALLLLIFMSFPMLVAAVAIRAESRGGALFRQERIGMGGKPFICYKFRTMYEHAPHRVPSAALVEKEKYITRVGRFLRKTSFDELPQLFNVLKGEMSIVGPRPLIGEESEIHKRRLDGGVYSLRPGITGMAQINGRDSLNNEEKYSRDRYYLENIGARLDFKIICSTFGSILCKNDEEGKF